MNTRIFISSVCLLSGLAAIGAPVVSDVSMSQDPATCLVTVKYRLSGDPGVITLDIQTNYVENSETKWVSIGPENMNGFGGDVHQIVQPTGEGEYRTIHWSPETYWPGPPKTAGTTRAVVTAWATNAPPDYMIVRLVSPYDVSYYPHVEMVPGGITNIKYKGEFMAFRKIPAKGVVWMAGLPKTHSNYADASYPHKVMLTDDYYMGVYEVTAAQKAAIDDGAPSEDRKPKTWTTSRHYRGVAEVAVWPSYKEDGSFDYEKSHAVVNTSILGKMRERIGIMFDLPTEHQWEYACRAGSPGTVYTETVPSLSFTDIEVGKLISRYNKNKSTEDCEGLINNTATVGSYEPNKWGLYDMLGNVSEACLDWYESWSVLYSDPDKVYVDPVGPAQGSISARIYRGYDYDTTIGQGKWGLTIGGRESRSRKWDEVWGTEGARLCVTLH